MTHLPLTNDAWDEEQQRYDFLRIMEAARPWIERADYAVANLETTMSGGPPYSGYPAFNAPDDLAYDLKEIGFDLMLTANNHSLDRGWSGVQRTLDVLDKAGLAHVGTGRTQEEADNGIVEADVGGISVAFLGYTYGTNGIPVQGSVVVDFIDRALISADIQAARAAGAEAVCVNLHWGIEYQLSPVASQRSLADFLVDQGVDLIIGGHPHVVEPMEMRFSPRFGKNVLLVYSLGNFISNQTGIDIRGGAMVKVCLSRIDGRVVVHNARCKLFFVQKPQRAGQNYVLIPEDKPQLLRPADRAEFSSFMSRTRSLVLSHNVMVPDECAGQQ